MIRKAAAPQWLPGPEIANDCQETIVLQVPRHDSCIAPVTFEVRSRADHKPCE